jgi:hypothetical protein
MTATTATTATRPTEVECPTCHAAAGESCHVRKAWVCGQSTTRKGEPRAPHAARVAAARKLDAEQPVTPSEAAVRDRAVELLVEDGRTLVQYTDEKVKTAKTAANWQRQQDGPGESHWHLTPADFRPGQWAKISPVGDGFMLSIYAADGGDYTADSLLLHERYESLAEAQEAAEYWRKTASVNKLAEALDAPSWVWQEAVATARVELSIPRTPVSARVLSEDEKLAVVRSEAFRSEVQDTLTRTIVVEPASQQLREAQCEWSHPVTIEGRTEEVRCGAQATTWVEESSECVWALCDRHADSWQEQWEADAEAGVVEAWERANTAPEAR